jgi:fructokinase
MVMGSDEYAVCEQSLRSFQNALSQSIGEPTIVVGLSDDGCRRFMYRILGIGELLWDMLPDGREMGGAPANFSVMASRLGDDVALLSRVGMDELGERAIERLGAFPVERRLIQKDHAMPTGQVDVSVKDGQAEYVFQDPSAWDGMELTTEWKSEAMRADAICFGTLAQRHVASRETVMGVVKATRAECLRIFDVNFRAPFFSAEVVLASVEQATVLKLNDGEMPRLLALLDMPEARRGTIQEKLRAGAERMLETFEGLKLVAVTCGGEGSLLVGRSEWHAHPGMPVKVVDTVGAGDAFTAALTHYLLRGAPLATLNEAGNRWGSFVASQKGAMPEIELGVMREIVQGIEG